MQQPTIEMRPELPYIGLHATATLAEWSAVNAGIPELYAWIASKGIEAKSGPMFRYWSMGDHEKAYDLTVGVLVERPIAGDERVKAGVLPAGEYAVAIHEGNPDKLAETHECLRNWCNERGREWATGSERNRDHYSALCEFYLTDPAVQPDPSEWRTQIVVLLAS